MGAGLMPAGPIGDCWATGSWEDTAWEDGAWQDSGTPPPTPSPTDAAITRRRRRGVAIRAHRGR